MLHQLYRRLHQRVYQFTFDVVVHALSTFKLREMIREELRRDAHNISKGMQMRALASSVEFAEKHLFNVDSFPNNEELWAHCIKQVVPREGGFFAEFGVWQGRSINFTAERTSATVYGFDSFEGLPERWFDLFDQGHFKVNQLPSVRANVRLVKGWFNETLPGFVKENRGPVLYLHIDCDLYSSTKTIFECMGDQIVPGTVIVFDEWYDYPRWEEGEYKAFMEFAAAHQADYKFIGYNRYDAQVALQITSIRGVLL